MGAGGVEFGCGHVPGAADTFISRRHFYEERYIQDYLSGWLGSGTALHIVSTFLPVQSFVDMFSEVPPESGARIMDRLFEEGLPRPEHLIEPIEQRFVCAFAFDKVLVEYRIQDPCIPKLKNYLLPSYTVILLIIIDIMPIAFVAFTYFWDSKIKEWAPIRKLRHRIEMNHQQRPGSREGIYNNGFSNYQITNSANKQ